MKKLIQWLTIPSENTNVEITKLKILADFAHHIHKKEMRAERGSTTRAYLERNNPNHPLITQHK